MVEFSDAWLWAVGTKIKVSTGKPPPSANQNGTPYKIWRSNNFTGHIREKKIVAGWRSLVVEMLNEDTGEQVEYLAHEIVEGRGHLFELA